MSQSTVSEGDRRCDACGQTFTWHQEHPETRHPFSAGEDGATDFLKRRRDRDVKRGPIGSQRGSDRPQIIASGNDPVLRIALINRGVLTPADLMVAEEQLREALANAQQEGGHDGQPTEGTRRG